MPAARCTRHRRGQWTAHSPLPATRPAPRFRILLFLVAALVFVMVVVGGITRLTESGLSITEWKPISRRDPAADAMRDWQHAFDLYKATPAIPRDRRPGRHDPRRVQVHLLLGMGPPADRPDDRHRLRRSRCYGSRPKRAIPKGYGWQLVALFVLGGLQGALGWFMVMSGLEGRTEVSPYRPVRPFADGAVHDGRADLDRARPAPAARCRAPRG